MSLGKLCEEKEISLLYSKYIQKQSNTGQAGVITTVFGGLFSQTGWDCWGPFLELLLQHQPQYMVEIIGRWQKLTYSQQQPKIYSLKTF